MERGECHPAGVVIGAATPHQPSSATIPTRSSVNATAGAADMAGATAIAGEGSARRKTRTQDHAVGLGATREAVEKEGDAAAVSSATGSVVPE